MLYRQFLHPATHNLETEADIGCFYRKGKIPAKSAIESEAHARRRVVYEGLLDLAQTSSEAWQVLQRRNASGRQCGNCMIN
jgi:hypothetical protein